MGSCVAYGCNNKFSKKIPGITFHAFPKNEERKALWVQAVRRKNWEPTKASRLCSAHFNEDVIDRTSLAVVRLRENAVPTIFESIPMHLQKAHFEPDQFEKNIPGKLKPNAVPTIFSYIPEPKHRRKLPKKRRLDDLQLSEISQQPSKIASSDHSYCSESSVTERESEDEDLFTGTRVEQGLQESSACISCNNSESISVLKAELERVKRKLRQVEKQKETVEKKFTRLFNSDQIAFMASTAEKPKIIWSDETMRKALQLRFSCGASGYSMLISQGFPLPSYSTLTMETRKYSFQQWYEVLKS